MKLLAAIFISFSPGLQAAESGCEALFDGRLIATATFRMPPEGRLSDAASFRESLVYYRERAEIRRGEIERAERDAADETLSKEARLLAQNKIKSLKDTLGWILDHMREKEEKLAGFEHAGPDEKEKALREAQGEVRRKIEASPELAAGLQDAVNYRWLRGLPKNAVVTLLIGSPRQEASDWEIKTGRALLKELEARGYIVLLDGHSTVTPHILDAAKGRALALVSAPVASLPAKQVVRIQNPYLLFDLLQGRHMVFSTRTSAVGAALALWDGVELFIDAKPAEGNPLRDWYEQTKKDGWSLGLRPPLPQATISFVDEYVNGNRQGKPRFPVIKRRPALKPKSWTDFDIRELKQMAEYANRMWMGTVKTAGPKAVVFGSSQMNERSSPLIYEVAYEFGKYGLGVATGGSGGAMLAANMGAYDAGGESLGVPMGGKGLALEKKTYSEVQTATIAAGDYHERIPWLLNGREVVVNAPGGSGTMREIVLSLIWLSQQQDPKAVILFLNSAYYGGLVNWLKSLPIDPELLARIDVVDSRADLFEVMRRFGADGRFDIQSYTQEGKPRGERRQLPPYLYKTKAFDSGYSGDSSWDDGRDDLDPGYD